MEYNVLLLGGHLCGKTSALASMFDEVINKLSPYFSLRNITSVHENSLNHSLSDKLMEMKRFAYNKHGNNNMFCMNYGCSISYSDTTLRFSKLGKTKGIDFLFTDMPGSFCLNNGIHYDWIRNFVRKAETPNHSFVTCRYDVSEKTFVEMRFKNNYDLNFVQKNIIRENSDSRFTEIIKSL